MSKKLSIFLVQLVLLFSPLLSLAMPPKAYASYTDCSQQSAGGIKLLSGKLGNGVTYKEGEIESLNLKLDVSSLEPGTYKAWIYDSNDVLANVTENILLTNIDGGIGSSNEFEVGSDTTSADITLTGSGAFNIALTSELFKTDYKYIHLFRKRAIGYTSPSYCYLGYYGIVNNRPTCTQPVKISQLRDADNNPSTPDQLCYANKGVSCIETSKKVKIEVSGLTGSNGKPYSGVGEIRLGGARKSNIIISSGNYSTEVNLSPGSYSVSFADLIPQEFEGACKTTFEISGRCNANSNCSTTEPTGDTTTGRTDTYAFNLCKQISNDGLRDKCVQCESKQGIWTAVGCVESKPQSIVKRVIEVGLGLGGGICLLMTLIGGFMLTISQGDTTQVNEAKSMITSAIYGLLFIIFSVFILQFIGVTILHIPGFGTAPVSN